MICDRCNNECKFTYVTCENKDVCDICNAMYAETGGSREVNAIHYLNREVNALREEVDELRSKISMIVVDVD